MTIAGIIIVLAAIALLVRNVDAKVVLLGAGILMAIIGGAPKEAMTAFSKSMTNGGLISSICSSMGFAFAMKYTKCDKHLIHLLAGSLGRVPILLVPGMVIATFIVNIAVPSAAGTAAAAGAVFIPLMISSGVHPAMSAAAIKAGTYGSMLNPGMTHNVYVGKIANMGPMDVVYYHYPAVFASLVVACAMLSLEALMRKEYKGYKPEVLEAVEEQKVNFIYALMPLVPIVILMLGASGTVPLLKMGVAEAMLIGALVALIVTRSNPAGLVTAFFDGMGDGYAKILSIIISASVFVAGMTSMGLVKAFIAAMMDYPSVMKIAATAGPFILGFVSGSGDAATLAFNEAVTPHAIDFASTQVQMGSMAMLGGTLGRTISPIAGATLIVAGIAGVDPFAVTKRNAIPIILALLVGTGILFFL